MILYSIAILIRAENVGSVDSCQSVIYTDCIQVNEHASNTSGLIIVFFLYLKLSNRVRVRAKI